MSDSREPQASRPNLPAGYGILGPDEGKGLLPWPWAVDRLTKARNKVYVVRPRVAFAFIADAADYPATATRWKFEGG